MSRDEIRVEFRDKVVKLDNLRFESSYRLRRIGGGLYASYYYSDLYQLSTRIRRHLLKSLALASVPSQIVPVLLPHSAIPAF